MSAPAGIRRTPLQWTCFGALEDACELTGEDVGEIFDDAENPRIMKSYALIEFLESLGIRHCRRVTVDAAGVRRKPVIISLGDLRTAMRKATHLDNCVPRENAFVALHECLVIMPLSAGPSRKGYEVISRPPSGVDIYAYVRGKKMSPSIFERRGMTMPDGSPISIKPGQIRF